MIQWWQILLLTLYSGWVIFDELGPVTGLNFPVAVGFISGLIMGDMVTGLYIGGSMQLMVLGIGTPGGASKIDAASGAILGTAFSVGMNMSAAQALTTIAVPVAALLIYTDILSRMTNTFFAHKIDAEVEKQNYKGIERWYLAGIIPWALSRMIPVFVALTFGGGLVQKLVDVLNGELLWLGNGLSVAGAVLPAVGFAILLRFLSAKKHIAYLGLGFTITILLSTLFKSIQGLGGALKDYQGPTLNGLPMMGIALIGACLAYIDFKRTNEMNHMKEMVESSNAQKDKGEIEDDEL